ncbi:MAG: FkbM family methyltransferase [Chthoniobacteraceae bacterium]
MKINFKQRVQDALRRAGLYHRLKASRLYDLYWALADRRILRRRDEELAFYRDSLTEMRPGELIIDVGANQGFKTDIFLRLGARVVAVDPDVANQEILDEKFMRFQLCKKPLTIVGKALGDQVGTEAMWETEPGSAKNTLNKKWVDTLKEDASRFGEVLEFEQKREVEVTTLEELFSAYGRPFYVKIDVEGYELMVLKGLQTVVPMLSFEVNLPEFRPEASQCIEVLNKLDTSARWNFVSDCTGAMAFRHWVGTNEMSATLDRCSMPSIEVFWKSERGLSDLRGSSGM